MSARTIVRVGQRELEISNLDKVLYPAADFSKAQVLDYYRAIAPAMLPHLAGPLTLRRFPNGVEGESFYEKECPQHRPDWVPTVPIDSEHAQRRVNFCVVNDLPTYCGWRIWPRWSSTLCSLERMT